MDEHGPQAPHHGPQRTPQPWPRRAERELKDRSPVTASGAHPAVTAQRAARPTPRPRPAAPPPRPPSVVPPGLTRTPEPVTERVPRIDAPIAPDEPEPTMSRALLAALAATIAPGSGHLLLGHRRTGTLIVGTFLVALATVAAVLFAVPRYQLIQNLLSTRVLVIGTAACLVAGLAWMAVIVRTYLLGRPARIGTGKRLVGAVTVTCLCAAVVAPLGFAATLADSQRNLIDALFTGGGGTPADVAIGKPRLNILLVGSDAGPDRTGARTDTMMVASVDTTTKRTTLFGLPRNLSYAQFPPGSPMAEKFPTGFHDKTAPTSGDYLLNAVYAYGREFPAVTPNGPTADPGLNLLHQTISYMLGLQLDYYAEVNMAGFASIIDALGGLTVDVGPEPIAIGGITPSGRQVKPDGYIPAGVQQLSGAQALAFARSRTNSSDYARMGRQRCLLQNIMTQKSPTDLLRNFRSVATATTSSVSTNIPQALLPALSSLLDGLQLESVSFDPNLPDPGERNGRFRTGNPDFPYMRTVVQNAIDGVVAAAPTTATPPTDQPPGRGRVEDTTAPPTPGAGPYDDSWGSAEPTTPLTATSAAPTSLAAACR